MLSLLSDPAAFELLWSTAVSVLLVCAGGLSIAMLPWTDDDIAEVDQSFRRLVAATPGVRPART